MTPSPRAHSASRSGLAGRRSDHELVGLQAWRVVRADALGGGLHSVRAAPQASGIATPGEGECEMICEMRPIRLREAGEDRAGSAWRISGTDAPARTGDPQIHNLVL
jgi:hypothetical protein